MNGYTAAGTLDRQPDLLARLHNLVRQLNRSDIRTVSSLIAKVLGDQNAGQMAIRLLHWFPKAKKLGGWVYKSWRDWNAECNLSQAQVKRVHNKGVLASIGIERTIMKANGTPTVHYRLDESVLIKKLAAFLDVMHLQIQNWMCPESANEDGQNRPSDEASSDQSNKLHQTDELSDNEPMNSAETAQSITDSYSQTTQQDNHQDKQHNTNSATVVDNNFQIEEEMCQSLGKFGISYLRATALIQKHGHRRIAEVVRHINEQNCTNPAGYLIRALAEKWTFWSKSEKDDYACGNGMAYITGKYAEFIHH
ncbi:MAG: hypothetical protein LCI00_15330 [Chloroflexi bacterium]|nr:hypothetical protein [Chloroflexota bacterium]